MLFIVDKYVTCVLHTDRDWVEEPIQKNVAVLHRRWISLRWGRKSKFISTHVQINILLKFHLLGDEKVSSLALVLAQFCLWTGEYHTPTNSRPQTTSMGDGKVHSLEFSYVAQFLWISWEIHCTNKMYILNKLRNTVIILFLGSKSHNTKFPYSQKKNKNWLSKYW